jgi:glutathione synthase/RimK-type ligase-like ATP-grasp enzyme
MTGSLSRGEVEFLYRETAYMLEGIYKILRDRCWISPIPSIREAENKVYQLLLAREIGFEIPKSLITTLQDKAEAFLSRSQGSCIIKPIKSGKVDDLENPKLVFTSLLHANNRDLLHDVNTCPTYLQNNIEKVADIRVTVVGRKVFAARINSQEYEETTIDWRKGDNSNITHERIQLPQDTEYMCLELTRRLGLRFGAIDLILDKRMGYVFLEINPNGQWGWIERRLGYDISGEIVNILLTEAHQDEVPQ